MAMGYQNLYGNFLNLHFDLNLVGILEIRNKKTRVFKNNHYNIYFSFLEKKIVICIHFLGINVWDDKVVSKKKVEKLLRYPTTLNSYWEQFLNKLCQEPLVQLKFHSASTMKRIWLWNRRGNNLILTNKWTNMSLQKL